MPIIVDEAPPVIPPPTPPPKPLRIPPPKPPIGPGITWTDVQGVEWPLSSIPLGFRALAGWRGLDSPTYQHYLDESPALDGSFWRGSRAQMREIFGPTLIEGPDRATAVARRRGLIAATDPQRGLGTLTVSEPDGSRRSIRAFRAAGMEGDTSEDQDGILWAKYGIIFYCPDPYFLGDDQVQTVRPAGATAFYPIYPLRLSTNTTFGSLILPNDGDTYAWPLWRIDGPCTAISLDNDTTGLTLDLTITLSSSQWVEIDTRPGAKTIRDDTAANRFATLADGSALWPLAQGDNAANVTLTGSGAASLVTVTYAARYLTA